MAVGFIRAWNGPSRLAAVLKRVTGRFARDVFPADALLASLWLAILAATVGKSQSTKNTRNRNFLEVIDLYGASRERRGCVSVYWGSTHFPRHQERRTEAIHIFLRNFELPKEHGTLESGITQLRLNNDPT